MSPQDVCDILVQAEEQSRFAKNHLYMIHSNAFLATLVRHGWVLSRSAGVNGTENDNVFEKPKLRKRGITVA